MNLPIDIIKIILSDLPIIDKRNLIRSSTYFYQLHYLMKTYENRFEELLNVAKFVSISPRKWMSLEYRYMYLCSTKWLFRSLEMGSQI